jgi:hypothetical protein
VAVADQEIVDLAAVGQFLEAHHGRFSRWWRGETSSSARAGKARARRAMVLRLLVQAGTGRGDVRPAMAVMQSISPAAWPIGDKLSLDIRVFSCSGDFFQLYFWYKNKTQSLRYYKNYR